MPIPTDAEWKAVLKKPQMKGVSDTGLGAKLRDLEKAGNDPEKNKKALEGLVTVLKKNMKDYPAKGPYGYFQELLRTVESELGDVKDLIKKVKSATAESVMKDAESRVKFKAWLKGKGKKREVLAIELWVICQKPPLGDDDKILKTCEKYKDVDVGNLGLWRQMTEQEAWDRVAKKLTAELLEQHVRPYLEESAA